MSGDDDLELEFFVGAAWSVLRLTQEDVGSLREFAHFFWVDILELRMISMESTGCRPAFGEPTCQNQSQPVRNLSITMGTTIYFKSLKFNI